MVKVIPRAAVGLSVLLAFASFGATHASAQVAPAGYEALAEQATNELATGNWAAARARFAEAHELFPNASTLRGLGMAELQLGQPARAEEYLSRALASTVRPLSPALRAETESTLARLRAAAPPSAPSPTAPSPTPPSPTVAPLPPTVAPLPPTAAPLPPAAAPRVQAPPQTDPLYAPVESRSDPRAYRMAVAGSLSFTAIVPLEGYADETRGLGIDGGVWIQFEHLVIEPRLGILFDVAEARRGYVHIPAELGAYGFLPLSEHALFLGPGVGMHSLFERIDVDRTVGTAVMARSRDTLHDDAFGFGLFGRLGLVLARQSPVSFVPSVEYAITFADMIRVDKEQAVRVKLSLLFGGGR